MDFRWMSKFIQPRWVTFRNALRSWILSHPEWINFTAWKVSIFEVILFRIFPHLDWYFISLRIQSECGKIRTRITPNTASFYTVFDIQKSPYNIILYYIAGRACGTFNYQNLVRKFAKFAFAESVKWKTPTSFPEKLILCWSNVIRDEKSRNISYTFVKIKMT